MAGGVETRFQPKNHPRTARPLPPLRQLAARGKMTRATAPSAALFYAQEELMNQLRKPGTKHVRSIAYDWLPIQDCPSSISERGRTSMRRPDNRQQPRHANPPSKYEGQILAQDEFSILWDNRTQGETFADGIGLTNFGPYISKLRFFRVVSTEVRDKGTFEVRELSEDIVIPTIAIFQWAHAILAQLDRLLPALEGAGADNVKTIKALIEASKR